MRRLVGVVIAGTLVAALTPGVVAASFAVPAAQHFDLTAAVMAGVFGEATDSRASLAAAYGDATSESPLRDLALQDATTRHQAAFVREFAAGTAFALASGARPTAATDSPFDVARALRDAANRTGAHFVDPSWTVASGSASPDDPARTAPVAAFVAGEYQPVAPVPFVSPQPGSFSFGPLVRDGSSSSPLAFGTTGTTVDASGSSVVVPATVHVGPVRFVTRTESASFDAPRLALSDNGYGAGANFDVRAGARKLNVDLSSNYERLTRNDASSFSSAALGGASSWQLPGADTPLVVPNYADMSKVSVGAALAVPVVNGLTLNLNYGADRMFGGYGMPGLANLDATDNSYGGKLTFEIPHWSSTLSISARQLRYQDNLLPANTSTQTREDVNFSVKF